jgi:glycosyltransferase involved in cell wall biosynthesis
MKILLLANSNSPHTRKWVSGLLARGIDVALFSFGIPNDEFYSQRNVMVSTPRNDNDGVTTFGKLGYLKSLPQIGRLIGRFSPDIIHAHYATSYGLMSVLSRHKKVCVSVWGSDVYEFPRLGYVNERILRFILKRADMIFSTSFDMARETAKFSEKKIRVIPFGINLSEYPGEMMNKETDGVIRFATSKSLSPIYNIPLVVSTFLEFKNLHPSESLELHVAGDGIEMPLCKSIAEAEIDKSVFFCGRLAADDMPRFYNGKDVLINVPDTESFGVSILEASAAGLAVIATRAGGIPEVVQDGVTGFLIEKVDIEHILEAMTNLFNNRSSIADFGKAGREFVMKHYDFEICLDQQLMYYHRLLNEN